MEFLTKDALFILIFIIPGYIGFNTFILFMITFFKAFKYRWENINFLSMIVISVIWSSITFTFFKFSDYNSLLENLNVLNLFLSIIVSVGIAEVISISIFLIILILHVLITFLSFLFYFKPKGKKYIYFSKERLVKIWQSLPLYSYFSDARYEEILKAMQNGSKITFTLQDGKIISGLVPKRRQKIYRLSELKIQDKKLIHVISIKDIKYISI